MRVVKKEIYNEVVTLSESMSMLDEIRAEFAHDVLTSRLKDEEEYEDYFSYRVHCLSCCYSWLNDFITALGCNPEEITTTSTFKI